MEKKARQLEFERNYCAENYEYAQAEKAHKHLQIINSKLVETLYLYKSPREHFDCSFCGKSEDEVEKLVASAGHYICNECIEVAYKLIHVFDN